MSVFRVKKNQNYTVMSNFHLRDKRISYKAKGLLSYMLSLPENWDYSLKGLVSVSKENESAIRSALKELETYYYLKRTQIRNDKGLFEYDYTIYEIPDEFEPYIDFLHTDYPHTENHTQINTKELNTNNKDKIDIPLCGLTQELIKKKFINQDDLELLQYDSFLKDLLLHYNYKDCVSVVNYVVHRVSQNNKIDSKFSYFKTSVINNLKSLQEKREPSWLNQEIKSEEMSPEEQEEMGQILEKYEQGGMSL